MKAHIIYRNYLTPDGKQMSVGGIQTYITQLIDVLQSINYEVTVYQRSDLDFQKEIDNLKIIGFSWHVKNERNMSRYIFNRTATFIDPKQDLLIFGCESMVVKTNGFRTIAIQHGISWDKPKAKINPFLFFIDYLKQSIKSWQTIKRVKLVNKLVCVDYNFINWYRALIAFPQVDLYAIPNFSEIPILDIKKPDFQDTINIIFARRFFEYRGTRIFAEAAQKLLNEFSNIKITIAGEGEDELYLKNLLKDNKSVDFIKYCSAESLSIHADKHIAVVPTLGSEGTSLSLLEAMASKCAVICTNVGGMTNVVIDGYNGLMVSPNAEELYLAMKTLVLEDNYRKLLSERAYDTVKSAFSLSKWQAKWKNVLS